MSGNVVDFTKHRNYYLIEKYLLNQTKFRPVFCFKRHARMTQNRIEEPLLARSGLIAVSDLGFDIPSRFEIEGSYKGVAKYANITDKFDDYNFSPIMDYLINYYGARCRSRIMSLAEVIAGTDSSKSPGYPINLRFRTKQAWFDSPGFQGDMAKYLQFVDDQPAQVAKSVWTSFEKNEALKLEKLADLNLRQVSGSDGRQNLAIGQFSKDFNDKFVDDYQDGHSRAGVPIQHGGWDWLFHKHAAIGTDAIWLDVKKHDSSMPRVIMLLILSLRFVCMVGLTHALRCRWYKLAMSVIDGFILLPDGVVVQKDGGNTSGNFDTLILNTLCTIIYMLIVWCTAVKQRGLPYTIADFDKFIVMSVVGDDVLLTKAAALQWLTPQLIHKIMADFGVQVDAVSGHLKDSQFLSHKFLLYRGTWVPYPVNCHKAVVNVLKPPTRYVKPSNGAGPNYPMLLDRVLSQRNRFFADARDPYSSYWSLFDRMADLYRPLAKGQRDLYPAEYKSALTKDMPASIIAELYMPYLEGRQSQEALALSKLESRGLRAADLWLFEHEHAE